MNLCLERIFLYLLVLVVSQPSWGCLWDSSIDRAFLRGDRIEICINQPAGRSLEYTSAQIQQAAESVRAAIRALDDATDLNFQVDADFCSELGSDNQRPRMRIDLVSTTHSGEAVIEPGFPTAQRNLFIPFIDPNGQVRSRQNITFYTQHEILHLIGIQHDDRIGVSTNVAKRREHRPEVQELTPATTTGSIMNFSTDTELTALMQGLTTRDNLGVLSHDVECIRRVLQAGRGERVQPSTPAATPETSSRPSVN